jgi:hypothetical protein
MAGFVEMPRCMLAHGGITAADMAAREALAKFHPAGSIAKAFFAPFRCAWCLEISTRQPVQVFAQLTHCFSFPAVLAVFTRVRVYKHDSATSGFIPSGGTAFGLLQEIGRPSFPTLRHLRNREQSLDFMAIVVVDAKYIPDGKIMSGSLDYPNLIASPHVTLDDQSQVSSGPRRLGKAAWKHLIVHPNAQPPARDSRLGNLENCRSDPPTFPDKCIVHTNPFGREILTKLTIGKRSVNLPFPPACIFDGVGVDDFIGSAMRLAIRLVVAGKIHTSRWDPTGDR